MQNKQIGQELENYVSDQIIEKRMDDNSVRDGGSGAGLKEKRDITTNIKIGERTVGFECKNQKVPHIKDWWEQTEKLGQLNFEPVLIYSLKGEDLGEAKAVLYLDTLLELIKNQKTGSEIKQTSGIPQTEKWKVRGAITALKETLKVLEKYNR